MYCPRCGHQTTPQSGSTTNFCTVCGAPIGASAIPFAQPRLVRPLHPRLIAGVCSGIALHFGWDVALVRILFVVLAIFTHVCIAFVYIAAWIMIPNGAYAFPSAPMPPPPYAGTTA